MATAARSSTVLTLRSLPEEVSSFKNIEGTFPQIFSDGTVLLAELAGRIQIMRLETEIFPYLKKEEGKGAIKANEPTYSELSERVFSYREALYSVNGQIERAIDLCTKVPAKDVRSFSLDDETLKVYDYCQRILPTLHDWYTQGTLLDKRFMLVMTRDYKNYNESITNYKSVVSPTSSFLTSVASTFSSWVMGSQQTPVEELEKKLAALTPSETTPSDMPAEGQKKK